MRCAIVVGRSAGALAEYEEARSLLPNAVVIVVGAIGVDFPHQIDHWVTFHAGNFLLWMGQRSLRGFSPAVVYWGALYRGREMGVHDCAGLAVNYVPSVGGSSGFLAAHQVALCELRCERVLMAGVPMTVEGGHYGDAFLWDEALVYRQTWIERVGELRSKVRSMSGWTRELLGSPTPEWIVGK